MQSPNPDFVYSRDACAMLGVDRRRLHLIAMDRGIRIRRVSRQSWREYNREDLERIMLEFRKGRVPRRPGEFRLNP